jgi:hypothetical protein
MQAPAVVMEPPLLLVLLQLRPRPPTPCRRGLRLLRRQPHMVPMVYDPFNLHCCVPVHLRFIAWSYRL